MKFIKSGMYNQDESAQKINFVQACDTLVTNNSRFIGLLLLVYLVQCWQPLHAQTVTTTKIGEVTAENAGDSGALINLGTLDTDNPDTASPDDTVRWVVETDFTFPASALQREVMM